MKINASLIADLGSVPSRIHRGHLVEKGFRLRIERHGRTIRERRRRRQRTRAPARPSGVVVCSRMKARIWIALLVVCGQRQYTMQCVDCHDRPTHAFLLPDRALNRALAIGH